MKAFPFVVAPAAGQLALTAGALLLPWSGNAIGGPSSRAEVLDSAPAAVVVVLVLTLGAAVALEVPAAVRLGRPWRTTCRVAGLVCSLGAVAAVLGVAAGVYGSTVRAYQVDAAGDVAEPVAHSHPGAGLWCTLALCLLVSAAHAAPFLRRRAGRAPERRGCHRAVQPEDG